MRESTESASTWAMILAPIAGMVAASVLNLLLVSGRKVGALGKGAALWLSTFVGVLSAFAVLRSVSGGRLEGRARAGGWYSLELDAMSSAEVFKLGAFAATFIFLLIKAFPAVFKPD
jgi:hypothetical protein